MRPRFVFHLFILAGALLAATPAAAVTLTVGSPVGSCGLPVVAPVSIDNASGMLALEFQIAYDTSRLTNISVQTGAVTSGFSIAFNASGGVLRVAMASATAASGSGTVALIGATVAASAPNASSIPLTISNALVNDIAVSGTSGAIGVSCGGTCDTPAVPGLTGPARATSATAYNLTVTPVTNATGYVVEESTSSSFTAPAATTLTGSSLSPQFTHAVTGATTYYYRARSRNFAGGCSKESGNSAPISVLVSPTTAETYYVVVVGSVDGVGGSKFRTAAQFHNWTSDTMAGKFVYHPGGVSASSSDPSLPYAIGPNQTLSFEDLMAALHATGIGSLDIVPASGPAPYAVVRIFNDWGTSGTAGMNIEAVPESRALRAGSTGVVLEPIDPVRMRFNIGIRTVGATGASLTIKVVDRFGTARKTFTRDYGANFFEQISVLNLTGLALQRDDSIRITVNAGAILLYGASTDNITQDPNAHIAIPLE